MSRAFIEYFRCPADCASIGTSAGLCSAEGYFRFRDTVGFGRIMGGQPASYVTDQLPDIFDAVVVMDDQTFLPFDLTDVVTNLREERYRQSSQTLMQKTTTSRIAERIYYGLRPFMGVGVRKHFQKIRLRGWDTIRFPQWPVDTTVDALMEQTMALVLGSRGEASVPFIWFWPEGVSACAMVTHDVEGSSGIDYCDELMDIDDSYGIKSAFQLVPEGREAVWRRTAGRLRRRGFEVNLHDLNHDGQLFADEQEFLIRAKRINEYAREFGCDGFRSAVMYRDQRWFRAFGFSYDMSVPNVAHLEPQRGGCCTVMPYFVGNILELPLTMVQDYSLFHILNDYSIALWTEQIRLIAAQHGLISVITHPDYLAGGRERQVYVDLLRHMTSLRDRDGVWIALPGEINRWWRDRQQMTLVRDVDGWRIEGPDSHRATVAYATLKQGRVTYVLESATDAGLKRRVAARA